MSRFRRPAAALFAVLLLQVISLGSGTACLLPTGTHARAIVAVASSETDPHAMHHAAPAAPAAPDGSSAHEHDPGSNGPVHCLMAVTCATAGLAAGTGFVDEELILATAAIGAHDDDLPPSASGAPEPPPPRA